MKIIVPDYAMNSAAHAMVAANVHAVVMERVADVWHLEFTAPTDTARFLAAMGKLGVKVLQAQRDITTGLEAGDEAP